MEAVLRTLLTASFMLLAVLSLRLWWRYRSVGTPWLTAMFLATGLGLLVTRVVPDDAAGPLGVVDLVSGMVVLAFPYLLFRFAESLAPLAPRWRGLVRGLALAGVAVAAGTLRHPLAAITVPLSWTAATTLAVWRLWTASRHQPSLVRQRLRVMALAAVLLNAALPLVWYDGPVRSARGEALALAGAVTFVAAFIPPRFLRHLWRRADERALWQASRDLVAADSRQAVVAGVLPSFSRLLGGAGALFVDRDGDETSFELDAEQLDNLRRHLRAPPPAALSEAVRIDGAAVMVLRAGRLGIAMNPSTPLLGTDELELVERLGTLMELALDRTDLNERERRARARAEVSSAELEALMYGVTHDLRTPLVTIQGYADVLREEHSRELDAQAQGYLARVSANAAYMEQVLGDLLTHARGGRAGSGPPTADLTEIAREVAAEQRSHHPLITVDIGELPPVRLHRTRARRLLTNLVTNAIAHSGRADVTVCIRRLPDTDGHVTVAVVDDGKGIPPVDRERVFTLFETGDPEGAGGGTGIGLANSRRIVEAAGGRIWVEGGEHEGADIRIRLPAGTEERTGVQGPGLTGMPTPEGR